jgi:hypothetical protein
VGPYVQENHSEAAIGYRLRELEHMTLRCILVLDNARRYPYESIVNGGHTTALLLQSIRHWLDVAGVPEAAVSPREWEETRALSRDAFLGTVWNDDPPGWHATRQGADRLGTGLAVPLLADIRAGVDAKVRRAIEQRVRVVLDRIVKDGVFDALCSPVGTHLHMGELPFYLGFLPESLATLRESAARRCDNRPNGLWIWRPADERRAVLGTEGDHTLGQAALPSFQALRAARLTGDTELRDKALDAMKQMQRYDVPRGAQTWECPLRQPDLLAAAQAVLACCEAYRLTDDVEYLNEARYWASCGLPFVYVWSFKDRPAMLFNTIPAFGSTFYVRSWLGQPVIWNGLVYAYALQDLAEFDDGFPWRKVAEGILKSALQQQYKKGPSKGCYPDSWHIPDNRPCPPDINPEAILLNGLRLYGPAPHIRFARIGDAPDEVCVNSLADIDSASGSPTEGSIKLDLRSTPGFPCHTLVAPVPEPTEVTGVGTRWANSVALFETQEGWLYSEELKAVVMKHAQEKVVCEIHW